MKRFIFLCLLPALVLFTVPASIAQTLPEYGKKDPAKKTQIADISCGKCQLHLKSKECSLAVRMGGRSYFVDGADIDSFGDAHGKEGFCNAVSKAEVQGRIVNGRFKATYVKLIKK